MALLELLIIAIGSVIVAKASDVVVEKSVLLAKFFKISPFVIGLVLVGTATNLPELTIAIVSSVSGGSGALSVGNVFGANITNIALVFGLGALLYGFAADQRSMKSARLALALSILVGAYVLAKLMLFGGSLGVYDGIALLAVFVWFAYNSIYERAPKLVSFDTRLEHLKPLKVEKEKAVSGREGAAALAVFMAAIAALLVATYFILQSAVSLAGEFGVATGFIGATIVSLGTTLPELSVALQAFRKKQYGLGLGDTLGSVITNTTLVLGTAALFSFVLSPVSVFAVAVVFVSLAMLVFMFMGAMGEKFGWQKGAALLLIYAAYLVAIAYVQMHP